MKQSITAPNMVPTANIAVNKSRLKIYKADKTWKDQTPIYYLQKGQEFQIELANPTTDVVLAKIILNGKAISQGGLVLNPGQRVFLDRYLDVAKKFLFDTYEVSGSAEMKAAIANNGDFRVEFYRERQPYLNQYNGILTISDNSFKLGNYNGGSGTPSQFLRSSNSAGITGSISNTSNISYLSNSMDNIPPSVTSYSSGEATLDWMNPNTEEPAPMKKSRSLAPSSLRAKSIETGRVEKGSDSKQELKYVNKSFEYTAFHTIEYKMLPVSQKINTVDDINVKRYCTQCGAKAGKTDNFCASCGKKI